MSKEHVQFMVFIDLVDCLKNLLFKLYTLRDEGPLNIERQPWKSNPTSAHKKDRS